MNENLDRLNELLYNGINEIIKSIEEFKVSPSCIGNITIDEFLSAPIAIHRRKIENYRFNYMNYFNRSIFEVINEMSNIPEFRIKGQDAIGAVCKYYDMLDKLIGFITNSYSWFESNYEYDLHDYYMEYFNVIEECKADDTKFRKRINMELALGSNTNYSLDDYVLIRNFILDEMLADKFDVLHCFE